MECLHEPTKLLHGATCRLDGTYRPGHLRLMEPRAQPQRTRRCTCMQFRKKEMIQQRLVWYEGRSEANARRRSNHFYRTKLSGLLTVGWH